MNQPEALRLAEQLESIGLHGPVAAELRRLHAENERIGPLAERVLELKAQRDALLLACKGLLNLFEQHEDRARIKSPVGDYARAAIAKAEGEKA